MNKNESLKLLSSMAARGVLKELAARFQQTSGHPVLTEAGGGVDVAKRLEAGETTDVVVLVRNAIDKLVDSGRLLGNTRVDIVRSGIAVAVASGAPQPDISTQESVRRAVSNAASISFSTGPSGVYLESVFARWGILEAIRERIVVPPPGVPVGSLVAQGQVELGFQQLSELLNVQGVSVVGPLPPEIQSITVFSGAVSATSGQPERARSLLAYLASSAASDVKRHHGMESAS